MLAASPNPNPGIAGFGVFAPAGTTGFGDFAPFVGVYKVFAFSAFGSVAGFEPGNDLFSGVIAFFPFVPVAVFLTLSLTATPAGGRYGVLALERGLVVVVSFFAGGAGRAFTCFDGGNAFLVPEDGRAFGLLSAVLLTGTAPPALGAVAFCIDFP